VYSSFGARQRLGKYAPAATNTHNNRRIVGRVYLWACLCILRSLLENNSVNTFPLQRRIFVGVIFYGIRVVLKESMRLFLPKTSRLNYNNTFKCHSRFTFRMPTSDLTNNDNCSLVNMWMFILIDSYHQNARPHGITSQRSAIFIPTDVRTQYLIKLAFSLHFCSLYHGAVSISDYAGSNGRMVGEK
jgi:hypothetical protein